MTEENKQVEGFAPEALAAELGIELKGTVGNEDAGECRARLDAIGRVFDAWAEKSGGPDQDIPVVEWAIDYALVPILGLEHDDRVAQTGMFADALLKHWQSPLLRILPMQTVRARLLAAALDKDDLTDSQVKMLRFKYKRSQEGLGSR